DRQTRDRVEACEPIVAAFQDAEQGVVVLRRDRVELVIVTTSTRYGQAEEGLCQHVNAVVKTVGLVLADIHRRMHFLAEEPERGAEDRFVGPPLTPRPLPPR